MQKMSVSSTNCKDLTLFKTPLKLRLEREREINFVYDFADIKSRAILEKNPKNDKDKSCSKEFTETET